MTQTKWDTPLPLAATAAEPFPVASLPLKLALFVTELARATETAPDLGALLTLVAIAGASATRFEVSPKRGYREPLNLMCFVALPPGERKSSVFREVFAPIEKEEGELRERARSFNASNEQRRATLASAIATLERQNSRPDRDERLAELRLEHKELEPKPLPRLLADDATPEVIPSLLAHNGARLIVASPEGGIISLLRGRYSPGMVNADVFLKGHAGDTIRIDRKGNPDSIIIASPALSAALAVQPTVLDELVNDRELRARGLVARFLFSVPIPRVGTRTYDAPDVPDVVRREYNATITRMLRGRVGRTPNILVFEPDAFDSWRRFALEVERGCAEGGPLVALRDWASKLTGATARLAGLLHVADHAWDDLAPDAVVTATVERAIELARYFLAHARTVYGATFATDATRDAAFLLDWLTGRPAFTVREAMRAQPQRFPTAETARDAIRVLIERGYAREIESTRSGRGRPPEAFEVHPSIAVTLDENGKVAKSPANTRVRPQGRD